MTHRLLFTELQEVHFVLVTPVGLSDQPLSLP